MIDLDGSSFRGDGKPQVGLLLAFLGPTASSELLEGLPDPCASRAVRSLLELGDDDLDHQAMALDDVYEHLVAHELLLAQGPTSARRALEGEVGEERACALLETLSATCHPTMLQPVVEMTMFSEGDAERMALGLIFLPNALALRVLMQLPMDQRAEVLEAMVHVRVRYADYFVNEVEAADGVDFIVRILSGVEDAEKEDVLKALGDRNTQLLAEVRFRSFRFEDLAFLEAHELRRVLEAATIEDLTLALSAAPLHIKECVFDCLSPGVCEAVRRDLSSLGPIRLGDVELAQRVILDGMEILERRWH